MSNMQLLQASAVTTAPTASAKNFSQAGFQRSSVKTV